MWRPKVGGVVRFLKPRDEALFEALQGVLGDVPLADASNMVAEGRVRGAEGEVFEWEGVPMVLPVTEALNELVSDSAYHAEVEAALKTFQFELQSAKEK